MQPESAEKQASATPEPITEDSTHAHGHSVSPPTDASGGVLTSNEPAGGRCVPQADDPVASECGEDEARASSSVRERRPYDCNICFDNANDPVVTRCGHLYCWPCLHAWLRRGVPECPVCKSGVTKESVVPIYGIGTDSVDPRTREDSQADIPERPRGEFTEPPQHEGGVTWSNLGATLTGGSLTLGVFPYGVSFTFRPLNWFNAEGQPPPTREEQLSQALSMLFLFLGIFVTVWLLLVGGGAEF